MYNSITMFAQFMGDDGGDDTSLLGKTLCVCGSVMYVNIGIRKREREERGKLLFGRGKRGDIIALLVMMKTLKEMCQDNNPIF